MFGVSYRAQHTENPTHFHVLRDLNFSLRMWTGFVWSSRETVAGSCEQLRMLWVLQVHGIRNHLNKFHIFNKCFYHGKSKFVPVSCHKDVWEEEVYPHTFLTSILEGVELSALRPGIFNPLLLEWEAVCAPESVGKLWKVKRFWSLPKTEPRFLGWPVCTTLQTGKLRVRIPVV
jgi:hypothetical protein